MMIAARLHGMIIVVACGGGSRVTVKASFDFIQFRFVQCIRLQHFVQFSGCGIVASHNPMMVTFGIGQQSNSQMGHPIQQYIGLGCIGLQVTDKFVASQDWYGFLWMLGKDGIQGNRQFRSQRRIVRCTTINIRQKQMHRMTFQRIGMFGISIHAKDWRYVVVCCDDDS